MTLENIQSLGINIDATILYTETEYKIPSITSRYRPSTNTGERKHNILSNISICGETDIENFEETKQKIRDEKKKLANKVEKCTSTELNDEDKTKEKRTKEDFIPASMPNQSVVTEPVNPMLGEDELTGLLLATNGWDECQLELLDSLLDSL